MIKIIFSRHAKRRSQLYKIIEADIIDIIERILDKKNGLNTIIDNRFFSKYKYPLKIVYTKKGDTVIIITAYPLKKGIKK